MYSVDLEYTFLKFSKTKLVICSDQERKALNSSKHLNDKDQMKVSK